MNFPFYFLLVVGFLGLNNMQTESLNIGDMAPDFKGVNQLGETVHLKTMLEKGPVILTFYRGNWCPYCNKYLAELDENYPKMKALGANLIAISPEIPKYIEKKANKMEHPYAIISNGTSIMQRYKLDFQLDKRTKFKYKLFGINVSKHNGNDDYTLPVPATYVIDKNGIIVYKHFDENYKVRAKVDDILTALEKANKQDSMNHNEKNTNVPNSVKIIDNHLDEFFDDDGDIVVLDEIESEIIHRDIFIIKANKDRPYNILLSCGLSALPMKVPEDIESAEFAELVMLLPEDWNLDYKSFEDERNYWPVRLMKELMMLPHPDKTWLGYGHTMGSEDDKEYADGVGFSSVLLVKSNELADDFTQIKLDENKVLEIYTLMPLYEEELAFKKEYGTQELLQKFNAFEIDEIVKVGRKNVCLEK